MDSAAHDLNNAVAIQSLQMICEGISKQRAIDLWEASNSSLERAIDIFFHQQEQESQQQRRQEQQMEERNTTTTSCTEENTTTTQSLAPITAERSSTNASSTSIPAARSPTAKNQNITKRARNSPLSKVATSPSQRASKQAKIQSFFGSQTSRSPKAKNDEVGATSMSIEVNGIISIDDDDASAEKSRASTKFQISAKSLSSTGAAIFDDSQTTKNSSDAVIKSCDQEQSSAKFSPTESAQSSTQQSKQQKRQDETSLQSARTQSMQAKVTESTIEFTEETSFQRLADALQQMADTTKRLVKLAVLETFIRDVITHAKDSDKAKILTCALQLVLGRPSSNDQAPLEVSGSAVSKSLQTILGVSRMQLSKAYRKFGDIGDSAASLFQKKTFFVTVQQQQRLTILDVYQALQDIVQTSGRDAKQSILLKLMRKCQTKAELRFLVRLLVSNMRIGANLKTVLAALAMATTAAVQSEEKGNDNNNSDQNTIVKTNIELIQKTHDVCPNLERIVNALLAGGIDRMKQECGIQVLTPIGPMLAHPIHTLEQIEQAMSSGQNSMVMEWKYDGVRCQAHHDGDTTKLFSRHMLETTAQYPDAAQSVIQACNHQSSVESFILDAEIVGVEGEGNEERLLPFQDLSKRKKKNDDGKGVRVKVFAFDLMYLNGVSYIDRPLWERQQALRENFHKTNDFDFVSSEVLESYDEARLRTFLEKAVGNGAEGLMLKMLGKSILESKGVVSATNGSGAGNDSVKAEKSPYEAGTRSHSWLKVKRDYVAGYADTIDVVPIGAWHGSGRKAQKSFLSPVLLAVYDEDEDVFRSISRCMSFSDSMYEAMREFYFRGTPYPPGVGIDEKVVNKQDEATETTNQQEGDDSNDLVNSDSEEEEGKEFTSTGDGEDRVNCFPSRPSSAYVVTNESPTIWFKPLEVFEVSFADMSLSRQHTAAAGLIGDQEGRGIALRFPRFKRRRPDKKPSQATTCAQIAELFATQSKQASSVGLDL